MFAVCVNISLNLDIPPGLETISLLASSNLITDFHVFALMLKSYMVFSSQWEKSDDERGLSWLQLHFGRFVKKSHYVFKYFRV